MRCCLLKSFCTNLTEANTTGMFSKFLLITSVYARARKAHDQQFLANHILSDFSSLAQHACPTKCYSLIPSGPQNHPKTSRYFLSSSLRHLHPLFLGLSPVAHQYMTTNGTGSGPGNSTNCKANMFVLEYFQFLSHRPTLFSPSGAWEHHEGRNGSLYNTTMR